MKFLLRCFARSLILILLTIISACGQKGKLIMPNKPIGISTPYPVAQPKSDSESGTANQEKN